MSTLAALTLEQAEERVAAIAGRDHIHIEDHVLSVAPADASQIAAILRFASANGLALTPAGSGSKLAWGNPVAAAVRMDLKRMHTLREHAWQDMTCTVEAGCTWSAMQAALARHRQMVALDPLWPERATVGGIVAANDSGALRLKYGGLRDLIIGMTIVLADGTLARTGGKVVKNVAGYDLHKLLTGSFGTLGVIAEVNFRLHPVEEHARTWTMIGEDVAQFAESLRELLDTQMIPASVQLRTESQKCAIDIRVAAVPECLDEHDVRLKKIFGAIAPNESGGAVWQARQQLFEKQDAVVLKVSLLPNEICAVLSELRHWTAAEGMEVSAVAQASGLMTVAVRPAAHALITVVDRLRAKLRTSGGSVVALQIPGTLRNHLDVWGCESNALPLMREIKRRFDPNCILNPGRFVGGI